jgi:hypothetical protein
MCLAPESGIRFPVEMAVPAGMRLGAHVELFKRDERTGEQVLIQTTRPCAVCGRPVEGVVIPVGGRFVHAGCRRRE